MYCTWYCRYLTTPNLHILHGKPEPWTSSSLHTWEQLQNNVWHLPPYTCGNQLQTSTMGIFLFTHMGTNWGKVTMTTHSWQVAEAELPGLWAVLASSWAHVFWSSVLMHLLLCFPCPKGWLWQLTKIDNYYKILKNIMYVWELDWDEAHRQCSVLSVVG